MAASFHARLITLTFLILSVLSTSLAATAAEWRSRSIYQVLTDRFVYGNGTEDSSSVCEVLTGLYCGGTWRGIMSKLDYIQGMKFDAIWISPVVAQLPQVTADGEAYTSYWQQDLYALNTRFGTEEDLKALITEVHKRDMFLMLDIVVNHMGYAGSGWTVDYSVLNPFNDSKYYHDYCTVSEPTNATNVQQCWLGDTNVALADLRTEDEEVQDMFGTWIKSMVSNYSLDGLRIDTSINVDPAFFTGFVEAAGIFATGEVMDGDTTEVCQWADTIGSILNYPIYYPLTRAFQSSSGSIDDLVQTIEAVRTNCPNSTNFGSFSENHDVARFASLTDDLALAKNIIAYTMLTDGIPIIFQGQEQRQWGESEPYYNRAPLWDTDYNVTAPLYEHIATLNIFRQYAISVASNYTDYMAEVIFQDLHSLAMRKGYAGSQVITVLNNNGQDAEYFELAISGHGYSPGTQLVEVLTCTNTTVGPAGVLSVEMFAGTPKVFYPAHLIGGSSLCGSAAGREPFPSSTTVTAAVTTTMNGHPTVVSTVRISPIPEATTTGSVTSSSSTSTHSPKALGTGASLSPSLSLVGSAAVVASVATTSWRALAPRAGLAGTHTHNHRH